jgi:hypothetical protein
MKAYGALKLLSNLKDFVNSVCLPAHQLLKKFTYLAYIQTWQDSEKLLQLSEI